MSTQDALEMWDQQGLLRGFEETFQQAFEKGIELGRMIEARVALRELLAWRDLVLEAGDEAKIVACRDLGTLQRWRRQALTATTAADALS